MSRETIEMVQHMETERLENQLIFQCAPLIVGLRMSNLFIVQRCYLQNLYHLLKESSICLRVLYVEENRVTILLYRYDMLASYLAKRRAKELLLAKGYEKYDVETVLLMFTRRYRSYRNGERDFPHELGVILGYPLEDVEGFIQNDGKNYLYTGYWKVYENVPAKRDVFRMFELAKETLIGMLHQGIGSKEILETYCRSTNWLSRTQNFHNFC